MISYLILTLTIFVTSCAALTNSSKAQPGQAEAVYEQR